MTNGVPFWTVDVFTNRRYAGNPLAVITDARSLDDATMQTIANEFGYAETTFVLPPRDPATTAHVRIFTPLTEVPFAGHPNVGTAFVLASGGSDLDLAIDDTMVFDEAGGPVAIDIVRDDDAVLGAAITAPQAVERLGTCDVARIARCLSLPETAIATGRFTPTVASVGLEFAFAELATLDDLENITLDISAFAEAARTEINTVDDFALCAFVVLDDRDNGFRVRSRVLSPLGHPIEDPATGSASGALASLLAASRAMPADKTVVQIEQGVEMGRPSQITVTVPAEDGQVRAPTIRGTCVAVSKGVLLQGGSAAL
ncbi:MAG: PhzF family phenazine biosynthesis protein [Pseudomonadota bacterium]